jgi:hypothetical protein
MFLETMIALAAWTAGFFVLCDFLRQMVTWVLVDLDNEDEDLFIVRE